MNRIEFSQKSKIELIDVWEWYESRQKGLGDQFIYEVEKKIVTIIKYPKRFPIRTQSFRETLISKFPYIIISHVFHGSRNPKKKYRKL